MKVAETPVYHFDPMKHEASELEKRIEQEAGPVQTYQTIEWFVPRQGTRTRLPVVRFGKRGIVITSVARRMWVNAERVKVGWDKLANALVIQPAGPKDHDQSYKYNERLGQFGSPSLCQTVAEYGFSPGHYEAEFDGKRILVRPEKRVAT